MKRLLLPAVALLLLTGCGSGANGGSSPSEASGPEPRPDPTEILGKAEEAMSAVNSYRVRGEMTVDGDDGRQQAQIFAEWASPDRMYQRVEGTGAQAGHVNEVIFADGRLFTRDSDVDDGRWNEQLRVPRASSSPASRIFQGLERVRFIREGDLEGQPVFRIRGERTSAQADALLRTQPDIRTLADLFIHRKSYRLLGLIIIQSIKVVEERTVNGASTTREIDQSMTANYDYFDYDKPISIRAPTVTP